MSSPKYTTEGTGPTEDLAVTSSDPSAGICRWSMFWAPDRLAESAWTEHVPFAFWLVDVLRPTTIVELGTYTGVSYSAMCQATKSLKLPAQCFAVDTWKGDAHGGLYTDDVYYDLEAFHELHYGAFSRLVRSTFDDALPHFEDSSIELLHIDGLHTYEAVRHDWESWRPKLTRNAVVLFHDTNVRERGFGVYRLWAEISAGRPHFAFLHGHGLGVLGLGSDYPPPLQFLFGAMDDSQVTTSVRNLFAHLGQSTALLSQRPKLREFERENVRLLRETVALKGEVAAHKTSAQVLEAETGSLEAQLRALRTDRRAKNERVPDLTAAAGKRDQTERRFKNHTRRLTQRLPRLDNAVRRTMAGARSLLGFSDPKPGRVVRIEHVRYALSEMSRAKGFNAKLLTLALLLNKYLTVKLNAVHYGVSAKSTKPIIDRQILAEATRRTDLILAAENFTLCPTRELGTEARINLILPALDPGIIFGGYLSVFQFANFLRRSGFKIRIIVVERISGNVAPIIAQCEQLFPAIAETLRAAIVVDRTKHPAAPIDFSRDDIFVAYSCSTAMFAHNTVKKLSAEPFIFYIQEEEGHFHSHNSLRAFCEGVYRLPHFGIYNSPMLKDYFALMKLGNFAEGASCREHLVYRHALCTLRVATEEELALRTKRKLLFFARPERHAERNLFELGLAALNIAAERGLLPPETWELHAIGTAPFEPLALRGGQYLKFIGKLPLLEYARILAEYDIGMSLMYSPHPNVVNLELSAAGVPTVTSTFINRGKAAMERIAPNLIAVSPTLEGVVGGLVEARERSGRAAERVANANFDWPRSWSESFGSQFGSEFVSSLERIYGTERVQRLRGLGPIQKSSSPSC